MLEKALGKRFPLYKLWKLPGCRQTKFDTIFTGSISNPQFRIFMRHWMGLWWMVAWSWDYKQIRPVIICPAYFIILPMRKLIVLLVLISSAILLDSFSKEPAGYILSAACWMATATGGWRCNGQNWGAARKPGEENKGTRWRMLLN